MDTPTLHTERLLLRPIALTDAPALQHHFAHWEIIRFLSADVPWPYPDDGVEQFLNSVLLPGIDAGDRMAWVLVPKGGDGQAIGLLEWRLNPSETDHRGFWLSTAHSGQGLMTEALCAFQDFVFFELGIDRLVVHNVFVNAASRRIKEKTGACLVGEVELQHHDGQSRTQRWEVTREAWTALRRP
jgi:[ribosomal protein S5]-alanine N-acetyltransferase